MSYIGVVGITKGLEVEEILKTEQWNNGKRLMAGVLLNSEFINGGTPENRNKYPIRLRDIPDIFISDDRVANFIKFEDEIVSAEQLIRIRELGGEKMEGLILSSWPPAEELKEFQRSFPGIKVFLEVPRKGAEDCLDLCRQLWPFKDLVTGVILESCYPDCSDFDGLYCNDCIEHLLTQFEENQININGLKDMKEIPKTRRLLRKYPGLGIMTEDALRNQEEGLELNRTRKYIQMIARNGF